MSLLTPESMAIAERTMSSSSFFYVVLHHLQLKLPMSVVRMGDGECILLSQDFADDEIVEFFDENWLRRMGMYNITYGELRDRLTRAANNCDYFAPSVTGLIKNDYNLYKFFVHQKLVDNFFVNMWTSAQILELYETSLGITLIHSNRNLGDEMIKKYSRFDASFVELSSWEQTEDVIKQVSEKQHQLVLFSAGCAGKYIASEIAKQCKVVIDVGNSAARWII